MFRDISKVLFTDKYELTMLANAVEKGFADRRCIFEVFTRSIGKGRRYGVFAGLGRFLEALDSDAFSFSDGDLAWLKKNGINSEKAIDYLRNFKFTANITAFLEGEIFFPGEPVLHVECSFAEGILLETLLLSILNYDSAVASAASRMTNVAKNRPCFEMGSRRTNEFSAVAAARAACITGFAGTSNLQASQMYGLNAIGTSSHAFTLINNSEQDAFKAQVEMYGTNTTLLVDTYDIESGIKNALTASNGEIDCIRIDSGDLSIEVKKARTLLDSMNAYNTKILVSSDLNEYKLKDLQRTPANSYGIGTSLVVGSGVPTLGFVYKLVAHENENHELIGVAKKSVGKESFGGYKRAYRLITARNQKAIADFVIYGNDDDVVALTNREIRNKIFASDYIKSINIKDTEEYEVRDLTQVIVRHGEIDRRFCCEQGVSAAQELYKRSIKELDDSALDISPGNASLDVVFLSVDD